MNILQSVARQMLEVSLAMSLVIAVLLLLRPFLGKRYRAKTFYWIWLLVALRLAVPLNVSVFHAPVNITVPDPILVYSQVSETAEAIPSNNDQPALPNVEATLPSNQTETRSTATGFLTMSQLASLIWITGAGIFLAGNLITYALFRRKIRRWSQAWVDGEVMALFRKLRQEMGVANITLAVCSAVPSPLVIGFIRPTLLLPKEGQVPQELEAIFRHELVHAGRQDLWYKLLLLIARTIHWFNPFVHLMAHRAERDLEISCDEAVVRGKSRSFRSQYGHAVLSATEHGLALPVSFTTNFKGGKDTMKERLATIAGKTGRHKGTVMVCLVTLLVALVATACSVGGTISTPSTPTGNDPVSESVDIQDVLKGNQQFFYVSGGGADPTFVSITDIPALFDPNDDYMAVQTYAIVDLDGDEIEEAVLWVCGAAGDTGGYLVLHRSGNHVYGYRTGYRTFESLKTDGTFSYSDNAGAKEGVATIGFTENGLMLNDILSATGLAYTMDTFTVNGEDATEEEYNAEKEAQAFKSDVEWLEFSML